MIKLKRYLQNYLIIGFPFTCIMIGWTKLSGTNSYSSMSFMQEILAWNLMLWFSMLTFYVVLLATVPSIRDTNLRRLANIKDRDEREVYITGKASRSTYITTLGLLILFFFTSVLSVSVTTLPKDQVKNGHNHALNIGFGFNMFHTEEKKSSPDLTLFDSKNYSLSKEAILLFLICWQVLFFNYVARKEQNKGLE